MAEFPLINLYALFIMFTERVDGENYFCFGLARSLLTNQLTN